MILKIGNKHADLSKAVTVEFDELLPTQERYTRPRLFILINFQLMDNPIQFEIWSTEEEEENGFDFLEGKVQRFDFKERIEKLKALILENLGKCG